MSSGVGTGALLDCGRPGCVLDRASGPQPQAIHRPQTMSPKIPIVRSIAALRATVAHWRSAQQSIGLVPTMGALHAGHLSLVDEARHHADRVVVSIFVNPTQFAPTEDLASYPRTLEADCVQLEDRAVDLVYAPTVSEMYPGGFDTAVVSGGAAQAGLEDAFRPHFFRAVSTVVAKLFIQSAADIAVFGEKDYQQLLVVRRMAFDLDLPVRVIAAKTIRDDDGLALSSRNRYLSSTERQAAVALPQVLADIAAGLRDAAEPLGPLLDRGSARLADAGFAVDYLEVRDAQTLAPLTEDTREKRVLVAARLGTTRLIDNVAV